MSADRRAGSATAATNLIELLEERAASSRGRYAFLQDGRTVSAELGYGELARRARAIASQLQSMVAPGGRALLLYPTGISFLPGFFGCLYAGVVAIPVPPPDSARLRSALPRLRAILEDAGPEVVLTTSSLAGEFQERLGSEFPGLRWLLTDDIDAAGDADWREPAVRPESLAYLQYTSGSTRAPRGVMLSHANLLHNLGHIQKALTYTPDSTSVAWMPYFHDYGLVEGLLEPLYSDIPVFLLSPLTVLKRPLRWLQAITTRRATHSHGPNFAYEMCLGRVRPEELLDLDLSSWRVAGNGAEPVRPDTLRRFTERFAPYGFREESFYPAYGLAEATLFVTTRRVDALPRSRVLRAVALEQHSVEPLESPAGAAEPSRTVMSCGEPQGVARLHIVDPETRRICPPDRVGEIWVASESVALGYWRKPEDSRETFQARLSDESASVEPSGEMFLRTGDLGFLLDGELYVTGRLKDMIIIGGVNHYPQDIEWTVQAHCPELRRDRCAAFSVERDGAEQLIVLAEPERAEDDWAPLFKRIRKVIATHHEIPVATISLLKRGGVLKTSSGKLQRSACRQAFLESRLAALATWESQPGEETAAVAPLSRLNVTELRQWVCGQLAAALHMAPQEIDLNAPFAEYGLTSRTGVALVAALEDKLGGAELSPALLWQYPTVSALCEHLCEDGSPLRPAAARTPTRSAGRDEAVAIVGMSCRFPGAASPDEFWDLLREGRSAITTHPRLPGVEAGFLPEVEEFDAEFFGISASEARSMDPQQRLLMEVAWEAMENAGLATQDAGARRGGIFVGIGIPDQSYQQFSRPDAEELTSAHSGTGLALCISANRLSYHFNLSGPSMAIDTACSSAMVAVHQAAQSLRNGECDFALAGGVNLILSPFIQLTLERASMLSPARRCKTFDADADGYVRGEGCGLLVLKRLGDAERDGDTVLALIRGSAVNQDGRSNGLTAPNPQAQRMVIRQALAQAGLAPNAIDYVEAHGTGTPLGDPIEMSALQAELGEGRSLAERCLVGSVKTNIGHLEAAAGIAGLMKAVLALRHAQIPRHLNLRSLNPLIKLADTPFAIADRLQPWPRRNGGDGPRRAAVSSFGFGGTNAHVILEEAPREEKIARARTEAGRQQHLFTLSARSPEALRQLAARHAAHLKARPETRLADLCFTTAARRAQLPERLALIVNSTDELAAKLQTFGDGGRGGVVVTGRAATQAPRPVFLFSGQGSQYTGMARRLYETHTQFRATLDECQELTRGELERPLLSVIFGEDAELLNQTAYTQPALFAVEYALARLWRQWGVEPAALIGHSLGEYVAACLAGVFDLRDGLRLITARGRLIQQLPQDGVMLAVMAGEAYLGKAIQDCAGEVSIAAVNAPQVVVVSGNRQTVERLRQRFTAEGLACRYLQTSHAFHSPLMEPVLEEFRAVAGSVKFEQPRLPLVSNLDGALMEKAPDADYWTRHVREAVRFADSIGGVGREHNLFLEIGPRSVLSGLGAQCLGDTQARWLPSLRPEADDWTVMLGSLAQLYAVGVNPDWQGFYQDVAHSSLAGLPSYPFQRKRFALPPLPAGAVTAAGAVLRAATRNVEGARDTLFTAGNEASVISDWGYVPHWQEATPGNQNGPGQWLVLADAQGVGAALKERLEREGHACSLITTAGPETFLPEAQSSEALQLVCLWGLDWPAARELSAETLPSILEDVVARTLSLLHGVAAESRRSVRLLLVSRSAVAMNIEGATESVDGLLQSMLWGLGRTLRREYPDWQIHLVDVSGESDEASEQLLRECRTNDGRTEVCWRSGKRYAWSLERQKLEPASSAPAELGGTWLITGGLGRLGLKVAEWLVERGVLNLLLLGRSRPGPEAEARIAALAAKGAFVKACAVDTSDYAALQELLAQSPDGWPPLQGVIHAAGVLDDGILLQQTVARFKSVLAPKVLGGWNLHRLTQRLRPRYFILFSSASSLLGNPGQGSYAAGNAFLDSLAEHRRSLGLPAMSLNWGVWSEAAADPRVASQMARNGVIPIDDRQGLDALERAIALDLPQLALIPVQPGRTLDNAGPSAPGDASLAELTATPVATAAFLDRLRDCAPEKRGPELSGHILESAAFILGRERAELDPARGFFDQGFDSLNVVELRNRLQRDLGHPMAITLPFNYPTAVALAEELLRQMDLTRPAPIASPSPPLSAAPAARVESKTEGIAVISMACRLPGGVGSPEEFWALLRDGVDAISEVPQDRWDVDAYYHPDPDHPGTIVSRYGGFVDDVEQFDAIFFGISPREARHLDPQQRLLLEVCWETLERAGLPPGRLSGTQTGVFIGISTSDYVRRLNRSPEEIDAYMGTGNALSLAANRLSFIFGFEGPSLAIDTACSSSLVAVHQACQSLRAGESDLAIAGGVNLLLDPSLSINHSRAHMLAPDGRCKAFSADADGFVRAEGCGLVLLKRMADAVRDGDTILGVIKGSAVNQDGRTSGLTVPNGSAQSRVIRRALEQAGLEPAAISYVEAHGTGTPLGDPIEADTLTNVFGGARERLTVGSVKTNIGHLESAAGVASLMKVVLALRERKIPAHLHCESLNPHVDWDRGPLRIPSATEAWPQDASETLRAGVSSFGFGGTNAHVILEEPPGTEERGAVALRGYLLPLSAKTASGLRHLARRYVQYLETTSDHPADICYTAACGRDHFARRLAVLGESVSDLRARLAAWLDEPADEAFADGGGDVWAGVVTAAANAERVTAHTPQAEAAGLSDWREMAARYVQGAGPDWAACYQGVTLRRLLLPGYPFERQDYSAPPTTPASARPRLYQIHWLQQPSPAPAPSCEGDRWLILADRQGWGKALAAELEGRGAICTVVYGAPGNNGHRGMGPDDDDAAWRALLTEAGELRGVLHLWGLDSPTPSSLDTNNLLESQRQSMGSVLRLARALTDLQQPARLWLFSRAAQAVVPVDRLEGVAQGGLWGLGRTLALEMQWLWGGLMDLPSEAPDQGRAALVCDALYDAGGEHQRALREGVVYAPQLRPLIPERRREVIVRPDASYLITGGCGTLGRQLGRWLVERGARNLWLAGRRGATSTEARAFLKEMSDLGVTVRAAALDVADASTLAAQLDEWQRTGPPLGGVIHAAGLNAETPLATLEWPAFAKILAPKLLGAWALQHCTAGLELDFFISCSSIAGLWGSQRQAPYSAANAFLDGLMAYRQARGQAALSVSWGPLSRSAMLSGMGTEALLRSSGIRPTELSRAGDELAPLLYDGTAQAAIVAVDWSRFVPLYQSRCATHFFDELPVNDSRPAFARPGLMREAAAETRSPEEMLAWLTSQMSAVLRIPSEQMEVGVSLLELGMDSLMAMELSNRLQEQLGRTVPLPELLGGLSLKGLASMLANDAQAPAVGQVEIVTQGEWVTGEI